MILYDYSFIVYTIIDIFNEDNHIHSYVLLPVLDVTVKVDLL